MLYPDLKFNANEIISKISVANAEPGKAITIDCLLKYTFWFNLIN